MVAQTVNFNTLLSYLRANINDLDSSFASQLYECRLENNNTINGPIQRLFLQAVLDMLSDRLNMSQEDLLPILENQTDFLYHDYTSRSIYLGNYVELLLDFIHTLNDEEEESSDDEMEM